MLSSNRIWKQRLINIGVVKLKDALNFGFSGPMLRGTGFLRDLRISNVYDNYNFYKFYMVFGICYYFNYENF